MTIAITVPALSIPHGGIRIIIEWANRLSLRHKVVLFCQKGAIPPSWVDISRRVKLVSNIRDLRECDTLIISSPHDINLVHTLEVPKKKFVFLQMLEHLFRPGDIEWEELCNKTYGIDLPIISISKWNIEYITRMFPDRTKPIHYIGNGVNFRDFPIETDCKKDGKTILIEGWESTNPSKDPDAIGPLAAKLLREDGYRIIAYSQLPLTRLQEIPHEYYLRPSIERLNDLYRRASILIKASKYDARACAPMEAMTKGCVTVRSIFQGDDDLFHNKNSIRLLYGNENVVYQAVKDLLNNTVKLAQLRTSALSHVTYYSWNYWMPKIEEILQNG